MAKENPPDESENKTQDEESPKFKTTVKTKFTVEEEDALIESFAKPIQELDNALEKQRQDEQNTMKKLIEENVKMEVQVKKADERVQEMHTKMELMKLDIEAEKTKTKTKENRIKEMENEMTMLILAKKSEKKKDKKGKKVEDIENQAQNIKEKYTEKEPELPYSEKHDKKIKDLNFRLRRLAADQEAKDKIIVNVEKELEITREYVNELEKEVTAEKAEEIKRRLADGEKNKNVKYYDPANIVSKSDNQRSATCTIQ